MIQVIILMNTISYKRRELLQAVISLIELIRTEKGCQRCDFCQSTENENELCLFEEDDTIEDLAYHIESRHFSILRGR